jgi:hypothetical protein
MTLQNQPENFNILSPTKYKLQILKSPTVAYNCQTANIPGIQLGAATQLTPRNAVPWPGDELAYEDLTATFIVDENLQNWLEIWKWMVGMSIARSHEEFKELIVSTEGMFSDINLMVLTNNMNPNFIVNFKYCWPTTLSEIRFDQTIVDEQPVVATVGFKYVTYDFTFNI